MIFESTTTKLYDFFKLKEWGLFFANFAKLIAIDLSLRDLEGNPVASYPAKNETLCEQSEKKPFECNKLMKEMGQKTADAGKPTFFSCEAYLFCVVPVSFEKKAIGTLVCGPVLLWEIDETTKNELLPTKLNKTSICNFRDEVRRVNIETVRLMADTLFSICENITQNESVFLHQRIKISKQQEKIAEMTTQNPKENPVKTLNKMGQSIHYLSESNRGLVEIIKSGDSVLAVEKMNDVLLQIFSSSGGNLDIIKVNVHGLIAVMLHAAVDAGVTLAELRHIQKSEATILAEETQYDEVCILIAEIMDEINTLVYHVRVNNHTNAHLKDAWSFIHSNYQADLSLEMVANAIFVSTYYLSHLFRTEMNVTFNDYILKTRMEAAVRLMKEKQISIAEIAVSTGFKDPGYFSKCFKKYHGMSPKSFMDLL
jgi:two-component system response regulator YesN